MLRKRSGEFGNVLTLDANAEMGVSRKPVLRTVPYPYSRKPLLLFENPYRYSKRRTHKQVSPTAFFKTILFEARENNDLFLY